MKSTILQKSFYQKCCKICNMCSLRLWKSAQKVHKCSFLHFSTAIQISKKSFVSRSPLAKPVMSVIHIKSSITNLLHCSWIFFFFPHIINMSTLNCHIYITQSTNSSQSKGTNLFSLCLTFLFSLSPSLVSFSLIK